MAKPKRKVAQRRKYPVTYSTASRVARIAIRLNSAPHTLSYPEIRDMCGRVSEKTVDRYVAALRNLFDGREFPLLKKESYDGRKIVRLVEVDGRARVNREALTVVLKLDVLKTLRGAGLKVDVEALTKKLLRSVSPSLAPKLELLDRKFFSISYGIKDYGAQAAILDVILRALIEQQRLRISYRGLRAAGDTHEHVFDPLTLAIYKGGLYLIGYSFHPKYERNIYLAVERIERVEPHLDARGNSEYFEYPDAYSPEQFTEGVFGIIQGPKTEVELELMTPETVAYLGPRRLHPTQRLDKRPDGTAILKMQVRGTAELATWILSFAPWVRVVKPESLRDEVRKMLADGLRLYERAQAPSNERPAGGRG